MALDSFAYNGTIYGAQSVIVRINAIAIVGALSLDWEEQRNRTIVYGSDRAGKPLGMTSGQYVVPAASLKVLRSTADFITTTLTPLGLGSFGDASFTLIVQCLEPDATALPITTVLTGCKITGRKGSWANTSTDALATDFTIQPELVVENGKPLWSVIRSLTV